MQHIVTLSWQYLTLHHNAILALLGGSAGLSVAIQWFLHHFKINGPKLSFAISHLFALATAASTYWLSTVHPNAGYSYVWLWFIAQFWHRFTVNPVYKNRVLPLLALLATQKTTPAVTPPATVTATSPLE
jgi:pheromone shutdown protein TraB